MDGSAACELWDPSTSTVLQVIVSIQGLVLCEMPYFNEAGYEKQLGTVEGAHHARRYNEGALLLSLKAMITTISNQSPPFERLIRMHYISSRRRILARLRKLLELREALEREQLHAVASSSGGVGGGGGSGGSGGAGTGGALASSSSSGGSGSAVVGSAGGGAAGASTAVSASASESGGAVAKRKGPVAEAELDGVLNEMPSLGFLHSLHRQMDALAKSLEGVVLDQPGVD